MNVGVVAPSPVPTVVGGAERLWWHLVSFVNSETTHQAELIKLPCRESSLREISQSYRAFSGLDLRHYDVVISGKYPAWMSAHPNHVCYMLHPLRGLYEMYELVVPREPEVPADPQLTRLLVHMRSRRGERGALERVLDDLDQLLDRSDLPPQTFAFPGPVAKEVVHFLDSVGLSPESIRKYAAISNTVARRPGYFPPGQSVDVVYPPLPHQGFRCEADTHLLCVGRLDAPKRIALLIEAMQHVDENIPLTVAGIGPQQEELRRLAAEDRRIHFLGSVSETELLDLYANSLAVLFVPFEEDLGFITLEAMKSAKPVITTTDSGGPLEFVRDGVNGFIVRPSPEAIAERIEYLCRHRAKARELGLAAERSVRGVINTNWEETFHRLIDGIEVTSPSKFSLAIPARRRKLAVATTFPITPPRGGGQLRVLHLYRHLATELDVEVVALAPLGDSFACREIAPGLGETRVPKTPEHEEIEAEASKKLDWIPLTDVMMPSLYRKTPLYLEALSSAASTADLVVACHPYVLPAIREVTDKPIWYEAQDVEILLKQDLLPANEFGLDLLQQVRDVEHRCCLEAELVLVCSEEDRGLLSDEHSLDPDKTVVVPNGVDLSAIEMTTFEARQTAKRALGLDGRLIACFIGSWHGPNLEAVRSILTMALELPEVVFLIVGSAGLPFRSERLPENVAILGVVDEETKRIVLQVADFGLNCVRYGSGTNLKVLEYCAAGVPVLSTPKGLRGLALKPGQHIQVEETDGFSAMIRSLSGEHLLLAGQVERARRLVEERYDWSLIARKFFEDCLKTRARVSA